MRNCDDCVNKHLDDAEEILLELRHDNIFEWALNSEDPHLNRFRGALNQAAQHCEFEPIAVRLRGLRKRFGFIYCKQQLQETLKKFSWDDAWENCRSIRIELDELRQFRDYKRARQKLSINKKKGTK